MEEFARLYAELDVTTSTLDKVAALKRYFASAKPADAALAVYFLAGGKPRQVVPTALLRHWACEAAGIPDWLFEESYQAVGDLAETIAHVLPEPSRITHTGLAQWMEERLLPLRGADPDEQAWRLSQWCDELDWKGRFLLVKLIGGGFRVGVSRILVTRALAEHAGLDARVVAQRMMGFTSAPQASAELPSASSFEALVSQEAQPQLEAGQPYPFFLAHQVDLDPQDFEARLGPTGSWMVEWKYDGIRAQVIKRAGRVWVWSRGEELVSDRFPEVVAEAQLLPDGSVLDGEILVWKEGGPAPFALLQQRIGRKTLSRKVLSDAPVRFLAYDVLEHQGGDVRALPQRERRSILESLARPAGMLLSPVLEAASWAEHGELRREARSRGVEGFMLKHREAAYGVGRTKASGVWWKWKIDPMSVDAVLVYAQRGHGRRASLYTDYTFAVWNRPPHDAAEAQAVVEAIARREPPEPGALQLVPFAKAYSGLSDEEFRRVDAEIRRTTLEKFGPVRSVRPTMMFELGFEGINRSTRHKSGIAVRFPRMLRIRDDKPLHEADTLQALESLLPAS